MTLLEAKDGQPRDYTEIAEVLRAEFRGRRRPPSAVAAHCLTGVAGAGNPAEEIHALVVYAESFGLTSSQARTVLSGSRKP
ncbi:hypothetical protein ACQP2X_44400 [Actinoplanes sp. CA-131856]